jgi:chloramphenicol-sensitive protein RarD
VIATLAAYIFWGLMPIYWKQLSHVDSMELLLHRIVWTFGMALLLVWMRRRMPVFAGYWRQPRLLAVNFAAAWLLAGNWLIYVWAIANGEIIAVSLGYYLTPLVSIGLAAVFLRERLNRWQTSAVALAGIGVLYLLILNRSLPWPALGIAFTWGIYSLLRKRASTGPITGLALETGLLAPLAIGGLLWVGHTGSGALSTGDWPNNLLLISTGVITGIPLLLYARGAQQVTLTTLGICQYIVPSMNLVWGIFIYPEPFDMARLAGFALIWAALVVYTVDMVRRGRN